MIFYGTTQRRFADEEQEAEEEEDKKAAAVSGPKTPTTVGLRAKHRTGKTGKREGKLLTGQTTGAKSEALIVSDDKSASVATLGLPGASHAGLTPPASRVRGRRLSFDISALRKSGKKTEPDLSRRDSLEDDIQKAIQATETEEEEIGTGCNLDTSLDIENMDEDEVNAS